MIKNFIEDLKNEYSMIVTPSISEAVYISFLVFIASLLISLSIVTVDSVIGSILNSILFS